jgi:hypothetical protein
MVRWPVISRLRNNIVKRIVVQKKKAEVTGLRHMEKQNMFDRVVERKDNLRLANQIWQMAPAVGESFVKVFT